MPSTGSSETAATRTLWTVAAALFTLAMAPAALDALQYVDPGHRSLAVVVCVAYALGLTFVALSGLSNSWFLLPALGIVAALLPNVVIAVVTAATVAVLTVLTWLAGTLGEQLPNVVLLVAVTAAAALIVNLVELNADLQEARGQLAVLAVTQERERIARDLHDVLGHSLTTIALKAGLGRRMLESGDAGGAAVQISDVEALVQQSLTDLRATVSDYKEITLATELAVAAAVLRAGGITADLPATGDPVDHRLQQVFGFVLREAVTNVIRHGRARTVVVRLSGTSIMIANDGPRAPSAPIGNGLRGLEERMTEVGGRLEAGPGPRDGFVVRAVA